MMETDRHHQAEGGSLSRLDTDGAVSGGGGGGGGGLW